MRPNWRELLFLHWQFEPQRVQNLLPAGLQVDTFDGRAYVGLVPFRMEQVRPNWIPDLGRFGQFYETFAELNVRTYVMHNGVPGVWFFSLDAASALRHNRRARSGLACLISKRAYEPKPRAMAQFRFGANVCGRRQNPRFVAPNIVRTAPFFGHKPAHWKISLVERYILYSARYSRIYRGRVHHAPYPLQNAQLLNLRESCLGAAGFARPDEAPHVLYSPGVDVSVWPLERA